MHQQSKDLTSNSHAQATAANPNHQHSRDMLLMLLSVALSGCRRHATMEILL
jgi:hypothetical protein